MKKILLTLLLVAFSASMAFAGSTPGSGIDGSAHDMNDFPGISDPEDRVCAFCHTPHHADVVSSDYMPLWSRQMSAEASWTPYASDTLQANISDPMVGPSLLCMSCHDGTVAPDAYYGNPGTAAIVEGDNYGEYGIGLAGDMSNDHPIGFNYMAVAGGTGWGTNDADPTHDPEIYVATQALTDRTDVDGNVYGIATIQDVLFGSFDGSQPKEIFTCASCHDVHNSPGVVENHFLYGPQADSQFCRMCHLK